MVPARSTSRAMLPGGPSTNAGPFFYFFKGIYLLFQNLAMFGSCLRIRVDSMTDLTARLHLACSPLTIVRARAKSLAWGVVAVRQPRQLSRLRSSKGESPLTARAGHSGMLKAAAAFS